MSAYSYYLPFSSLPDLPVRPDFSYYELFPLNVNCPISKLFDAIKAFLSGIAINIFFLTLLAFGFCF